MRTYATAQHTGTDPGQCDATAVRTSPDGTRAYVLLDGIGRRASTHLWALGAARQIARTAARRRNAEAGLRHVYNLCRNDAIHHGHGHKAAAVVAVKAPAEPLTVAWCGDSRAYLMERGIAVRLTDDHNKRRVYPPTATYLHGGRNHITSCLGSDRTDEDVRNLYRHPAIETATREITGPCRLLLASDGAYEPHEGARHCLFTECNGDDLVLTVRNLVNLAVDAAVKNSRALDPNQVYADNATALLADLAP
ncbi:mucin-2 [Streptomyces syringium]|uniref:mucin-2 n=1 Tax=Streptomyces syringium TaxID=76729 RepID=UPI0034221A9A